MSEETTTTEARLLSTTVVKILAAGKMPAVQIGAYTSQMIELAVSRSPYLPFCRSSEVRPPAVMRI